MVQLIYISRATYRLEHAELTAILETARRNNAGVDVTGVLVHVDDSFLQVLEGPREAVLAIFEQIKGDERHAEIRVLTRTEIDDRDFPDWRMGFVPERRVREVPGFIDFVRRPESLLEQIDGTSRARRLLAEFHGGRWR